MPGETFVHEPHLEPHRLEALGRLAGGVAHDFNNLLTAILGHGSLLLERLGPADPLRANVEEIRKAGHRAAALVRRLLLYSRSGGPGPAPVDLNAAVSDMADLLRPLMGEDIELVTSLDPDAGRILADRSGVEQVIMNLAVNARDAMARGGRLEIKTAAIEGSAAGGRGVRLTVSDTGTGMDAETVARLFEPFFTTKEPGRGTGLGLPTVYASVTQSGGAILVQSEPGRGTSFVIDWPRTDEALQAAPEPPEPVAMGGTETILLVEDEPSVRSLAHEVLRQKGYAVIEAGDGREAIRLCAEHRGSIDLLLTDLVMPGMSGSDVAGEVRRLRPGARVLYMTGYAPEGALERLGPETRPAILGKPFTPCTLARKVREMLDGPPRAA